MVKSIEKSLLQVISNLLPDDFNDPHGETLGLDTQFDDFGLSSSDVINIILAIESDMDTSFDERDLTPENFSSIRSIAALLEMRSSR